MISLFLNTSSNYLTVAIYKDEKVVTSYYEKLDKDLSRVALLKVKEVIEEASFMPDDIDRIYCVNGPGSFTGLRVGVTIAKTFAYFLNKELYEVSSLYVMACSYNGDGVIVPIIDARRGYVFAGIYDNDMNTLMTDRYILLDELNEKLKEYDKYTFVSDNEIEGVDVTIVTPLFDKIMEYNNYKKVDSMTFVPNYLKKTEAEENLNK